ncbi:MAG: HDIG domain-containing protein, partial [Smithellaceae bacterium]|nr:HDIG domain-containing protein [Smithellaceae bacterium]
VATRWLKPAIDLRGLFFLTAVALVQMVIIKVGIFLAQAVNQTFPFITPDIFFFSIPFGVGAMLVIILMNHSTAIIYSIFLTFLVGFFFEGEMAMALYCFAGSMAVTNYIRNCRRRSDFFRAGLYLSAVNGVTAIILTVMTGEFSFLDIFLKVVMGITGGIVAGFIVAGITPIFETLFDFITEIRLLELANLNNPLFQRMVIEAPGTYHHSIIVASLVEGAAESIKANPLLAKVSAYYHDIGKLKKPHYFIENQINGDNRHDRLSTTMSSLVIISHVKDGCDLATEMKLGSRIRDVIRQHHGNSLVGYFWEKAKKEGELTNSSVSESDFRYPGPKPQTREAGLVLLGDVIEASSRALKNPTPARINNLVRERFEKIFLDGQLDECEITLRDLNIIAESFIKILNGIFHHRVDYYPEPVHREAASGKKENNGNPDRKQAEKSEAGPASHPEIPR